MVSGGDCRAGAVLLGFAALLRSRPSILFILFPPQYRAGFVELIQPNQEPNCADASNNQIVKVSHILLTRYWGHLLITQASDGTSPNSPGMLFIEDLWFREGIVIPEPSELAIIAQAPSVMFGHARCRKRWS